MERFDDARREFETLAAAEPEHVDVLYALGLIHLQAARLDEAAPYFERLGRLRQRVSDSNYYLGRIAEERANWTRPVICIRACMKATGILTRAFASA